MKLTIEKTTIDRLVKGLLPFTNKRDESNVSSCIRMEVKDYDLILKATDYEIGMTNTLNNVINPLDGECLVNGVKLSNSISRLKSGEINISIEDDTLILKQKRTKIKIELFDDSFPGNNIDTNEMTNIDLDTIDINNSFKSVLSGVDVNNPKFELGGILISIKDGNIDTVSTDTRCLIIDKKETNIKNNIDIIVPKKAILEIQNIIDEVCSIYIDDVYIVIQNNNITMFSKLINGKFPDYKRVIPNEFNYIFSLNKDDVSDSIKTVTGFDTIATFTFSNDNILVESGIDKNKSETYIEDLSLNIQDKIVIKIDTKFLLNFLNVINGSFEICINEKNLPVMLRKNTLTSIVMPVVDNDAD